MCEDIETLRRQLPEDRSRDSSDVSISQGMPKMRVITRS